MSTLNYAEIPTEVERGLREAVAKRLAPGDLDSHVIALILKVNSSAAVAAADFAEVRTFLPWTSPYVLRRPSEVALAGCHLALGAAGMSLDAFAEAAKRELARMPNPPAACLRDDDRLLLGIAAGIGVAAPHLSPEIVALLRGVGRSRDIHRVCVDAWAGRLADGSFAFDNATALHAAIGLMQFDLAAAPSSASDRIAAFWLAARLLMDCSTLPGEVTAHLRGIVGRERRAIAALASTVSLTRGLDLGLLFDAIRRSSMSSETVTVSELDSARKLQMRRGVIDDSLSHAPEARILHLSDLHFGTLQNARDWFEQLAEDLLRELSCTRLDAVVFSGDIANFSRTEEYEAAQSFTNKIGAEFGVAGEQWVLAPGNHDLNWSLGEAAYSPVRSKTYTGSRDPANMIDKGEFVEALDQGAYRRRFEHFAAFHSIVKGEPYPVDYEEQFTLHAFPSCGLLIVGLNSAWQIDHHYRARVSIHPGAVSGVLARLRHEPALVACQTKIAVWHHPLQSADEDRIKDYGFLEQLAKAGFRVALHGHIHKSSSGLFRYDVGAGGRQIEIVGAGTFGAPVREWAPGFPLQYNLLELRGTKLTVRTRKREELHGAWKPDARWVPQVGMSPLPHYELDIG